MERIQEALKRSSSASYEPLIADSEDDGDPKPSVAKSFSWLDYSIFLLLGISMLWAWYKHFHFLFFEANHLRPTSYFSSYAC